MSKSNTQKKLLEKINSPADLKGLSLKQLDGLAAEIRQEIIETVAKTGGHLAPSLGVVELTLALHYVFDAPKDKVIWDVGHQAYAHKLITGRREQFHTLRTYGGLSGFPKRAESPYDSFDTGHSSTSISAGLGISTAKALKGENGRVISVIGDGSMTAGMAFEGLNQAGHTEKDLIVVLNDNAMSISPNVGSFSSFLSRKMTGKRFINLKKDLENFIKSLPGVGENILSLVRKSEDSFITFFTPGMMFEAFKFKYIGPINGHRLDRLIEAFSNTRHLEGPVLVHVLTVKGKGYEPAEKDPAHFHGVGAFEIPTGTPPKDGPKPPPSYTDVFGNTMVNLGRKNQKLFAITAAMPEGTGLAEFAEAFPERFLDVGIAEQHAVTFAAGLATEGFRPVVAIYSTFLQRAYDQVIHDVCLPNLPVVFAIDRGGLVGEDGPTHHGLFDITYLRSLPNMTVMAPKDENELRHMIYTALQQPGPTAIRYPRGKGLGVPMDPDYKTIPIGQAEILRQGKDLIVLALGSTVYPSLDAAASLEKEGLSVGVVNCRFVKPIDVRLADLASSTNRVLVVEENIRQGGLGGAILELFNDMNLSNVRVKRIGLPDKFVEHGPSGLLKEKYGLDTSGIIKEAKDLIG
ncbi:MAG: 1-deoxy-D-xylulose-5-phosphate synthase [Deltaproteobacteria bacterium]|nr:1-deoxy-D-xylulose-5-phosphate synthase [Deltaproteobacteria bacterium]MBW1737507.1 1-deoxy-D-xylulose-5-phosphate synthase [Deltaproteobacteria bacterium]MBW1910509.1 1-deoxy-D-xylulose-5-phosphate synthase [Deltaproteobacteria bacterium]MBW2034190.1 1-deoxy-D-xylulose-5-phosphate synthase [Deltaproteobacteria bacterium]MBW2115086.1 1-deoxy-D-xylulose-5-phosphate synthase [Deltaproteobacteria bacterium]